MKKLNQGFTLIELMVVVAITGVIMAAGILAFSNAQVGARDSKRKGDVDAMAKAMEQYFQANGSTYPLAATASASIRQYFPSNNLPKDPKDPTTVYTVTANTGTTYCICAQLEKLGTGNATGQGGTSGTCAYSPGGNFFCASQRQ